MQNMFLIQLEQAKTAYNDDAITNSGTNMTLYSSYTPDFKCTTDTNGKGIVNASIGLLSYDEVVYAGGYYNAANDNYYLHNSAINWWTMSPAGFSESYANVWYIYNTGDIDESFVHNTLRFRAIVNLKADTMVAGSGTSLSPYLVQ